MEKNISDMLFRSLGTHALKAMSLSQQGIRFVVAPWDDLKNEATAAFENVDIIYIESDGLDLMTNFNLPWDIIRFDSNKRSASLWEFGLCCDEIKLGFTASMPKITFQ
ncbi:hypothetical protein N480_05700 [Pseudoalteromonas luteoviolacea S2607]|uniref:hypothetical protein n=1 Tax=Pseudoalteromonas luteoviolacea TaxID=43657 RepID=UPI0007B067FA|nr:hypothetical protein [Pseudoalteromonas luteoviolacea]KZN30447.1 hypothetical protein N480_05700 [Pseudoalteromonas luteoviolacea S2607]